ncbi:probable E3 ubiquitin-protein ligase HERC4 [Scylla paramamosain]|uniref:probable E3 ubiquitin-protein ligase HERC4 n=1 Tax=Scylla paramamosain TaxID=85552 RepID=UPI00308371AB
MNSRLHPMSRRESPILFCEYPFLFDPQAKTLLLRCDATRQVRTRANVSQTTRSYARSGKYFKLSLEQKKWFLKFLTGTDRVPILGMKALKLMIQSTADDSFLPVAHTCITQLDLPRYNTKEKLKYKLLQAVQQSEGFGLV